MEDKWHVRDLFIMQNFSLEIIFLQNFKTLLHCLLVPDLLSRSMKLFSFLIFKDFLFVTSFKQHDCDMPMCGFLLGVYQAGYVGNQRSSSPLLGLVIHQEDSQNLVYGHTHGQDVVMLYYSEMIQNKIYNLSRLESGVIQDKLNCFNSEF